MAEASTVNSRLQVFDPMRVFTQNRFPLSRSRPWGIEDSERARRLPMERCWGQCAAALWSVAIAVVPEKTDCVAHFYERLPGPHPSIRAGNDPGASINGRSCARKPDDLEL